MKFVPFPAIVGPTYTLASLNAECQRCVNLMLEKVESGVGQSNFYLRETPGLLPFLDPDDPVVAALPVAAVKQMHVCGNGRVFVIIGNGLYEMFSNGSLTEIDNNLIGSGTVGINTPARYRMSDNTNVLAILIDYTSGFSNTSLQTFGLTLYRFSDGAIQGLSTPIAGFIGTKFISFLDQYFITTCITQGVDPNALTSQFQISPLSATIGSVWSASDVFTAESTPDNINAIIVNGRELWVFGLHSYEVWFNSGDAVRPFQRIRDAAYPIGCIAPESVQAFQGRVFWLGSSEEGYGIVWMSNGLQAERASTTAIERLIKSFPTIDDAIAWTYQIEGHAIYVLTLPSAGVTYAYDLFTNQWHELSYRNPTTGVATRHRAANQIFAFGKNLVGDFENGMIYELSTSTYTDDEAPIIRYRRAPVLAKGERTIFYHKLEIVAETGVGLPSGEDPLLSIRWSNDNGHTWGNYHTRSLGLVGEYKKRIILNMLGSSRRRVFEVYLDAPVPLRIISAELGLSIGVH